MSAVKANDVLSHWNQLMPGLQQSSAEFYGAVDQHLKAQGINETKTERVNFAEGGILSAKREYLQVRRKEHVFHICAAPFGSGFFVSWWLGEVESGLWATLSSIPYIGFIFRLIASVAKPTTYYRIDTALMFQAATHGAVLSALDAVTSAKGMRALTEIERKPIMRDFFGQLGAGGK